ncbi:MAG: hypothetical protein ACXVXL_21085 [Solirubrobacteraceae bacterium]
MPEGTAKRVDAHAPAFTSHGGDADADDQREGGECSDGLRDFDAERPFAARHGGGDETVPSVRAAGGLADTVVDHDHACEHPLE